MVGPIILGLAVGAGLTYAGFVMAGGGHGTSLPMFLFAGPLALLFPLLATSSPQVHNVVTVLFLSSAPLLYGGYAGLLDSARKRAKGGRALLKIAALHYASFAISAIAVAEGVSYFRKVWTFMPGFMTGSAALFLAAQVAALVWVTRGPRSEGT